MFLGKVYGTSDVRIAELGRKANFAQVRIDGRVSGDVRVYASDSDSGMSARGLEFEAATKTLTDLKVPHSHPELTGEKVLTLELLHGPTLKEFLHHLPQHSNAERFRVFG